MTEYKSLRVPVDAWEAAKAQKEDADRTWGDQIVRPDGDETDDVELGSGYEEIAEKIAEAMDGGGGDVDLTPVMNRLDDLETQLPSKVATEVHSQR